MIINNYNKFMGASYKNLQKILQTTKLTKSFRNINCANIFSSFNNIIVIILLTKPNIKYLFFFKINIILLIILTLFNINLNISLDRLH